jgi:hypothetical protein
MNGFAGFTNSRGFFRFHAPASVTAHLSKAMALTTAIAGMMGMIPVEAAVNLISVQHRVWGYAGFSSYDQTGPSPLSRSATEIPNHASSTASDWAINAYASNENAFEAGAQAQNTYRFTPSSREISISLNGVIGVWWRDNAAKMELRNKTTNDPEPIIRYLSPSYTGVDPFIGQPNDRVAYPFTWSATLDLEPEHEYELILHVGAFRGEGGDGSASLNLSIVPEPGVSLLAGIAALLACGRRRRPEASI